MLLSNLASRPRIQASRSDYVRDFLSGADVEAISSDAGPGIGAEAALRVAVVHRGINVLAHAPSSVPLVLYERLPDGGKRAAVGASQYRLLHDRPNAWMTSFRWRHLMMVRAVLYGDSYHQLLPGPGGISQIVPLEPATTKPVDQASNGKLVYVTRDLTAHGYGPERRLVQDEVLHVRGMSLDGKRGMPFMEAARNAIGLSLAAEKHGSMFLRQGARFSGILSYPGDLDDQARKDDEASWARAYGGPNASGLVPALSGGVKYQPISQNNRDSQWGEARAFQVEELLRFLGVPGVLVGYLAGGNATYASAEQFFLSFVKDTVRPWTENIAAELNFSVVMDPDRYFVEFDLSELLKGDIKTRYSSNQSAILAGWKSRNEVRRDEHMDPGPAELDEFLAPLNMVPAGAQQADAFDDEEPSPSTPPPPQKKPQPDSLPAPTPDDGAEEARLRHVQFVVDAAARVVRREIAAIKGNGGKLGAAVRFAKSAEQFDKWLCAFYEEHRPHVAEAMHLDNEKAGRYTRNQLLAIRTGGLVVLTEEWERESINALAFEALGQEH